MNVSLPRSPAPPDLEPRSTPPTLEAADRDVSAAPAPPPWLVWTLGLMLAGVFLGDLFTPDTFEAGVLFNVCIALTLWSWTPRWVGGVTLLSLLLRVLAHLAGPPLQKSLGLPSGGTGDAADAFNLTVGLFVQTLTGLLIWRQVWVQSRLEMNQREASRREWERRRTEAALLVKAQEAEKQTRDRAQALHRALEESRRAREMAEAAAERERRALESERAARRRERESLQRERETSSDLMRVKNLSEALHRAVLPKIVPQIAGGRVLVGARYVPAERVMEIGGDFYDLIALDAGESLYGLVIGDVAGHGVEAAAQTALVITTLRAYAFDAARAGEGPADVLSRVARAVDGQLESFVSMFYGVYNADTGSLLYANAGHEPPIHLSAHQILAPLSPTGTILGIGSVPGIGVAEFTETETRLCPGDSLVLMTDGVTEARSHEGRMLGWDGVAELARRRGPQSLDAESLADSLLHDVRAFAVDGRLTDDVALVVVRIVA